jgi:hypothetical protein
MPVVAIRRARRAVAWWRRAGWRRTGWRRAGWRAGPAAAALIGVTLLAAGCAGGSPAGAAVASLPTASATASQAAQRGDPVKYSQCMRAHGVSNFPDPDANGGIAISAGKGGLDPRSPKFKAAEAACKPLAPQGPPPDPKAAAAMQQQFLAYAKCMRSNGILNFPDPKFEGNRVSLSLPPGVNPKSTKFKAADKACKKLAPQGGSGPTDASGPGAGSSGGSSGGSGGTQSGSGGDA